MINVEARQLWGHAGVLLKDSHVVGNVVIVEQVVGTPIDRVDVGCTPTKEVEWIQHSQTKPRRLSLLLCLLLLKKISLKLSLELELLLLQIIEIGVHDSALCEASLV